MNRSREVLHGDHGFRVPRNKVSNCFKDREEELSFFRDLRKHQKDHVASLLQPVSDEFEANAGNYGGLYRMESSGRKGPALEFLAESGKNDYNWLKTPPATPLFPSLEMDAGNGQELVVQREIPIIQPLSRFAGNKEGVIKTSTYTSTSQNPKPKLPQIRHKTPTGRPSIPSSLDKKNMKIAPVVLTQKTSNQSTSRGLTENPKTKPSFTPVAKSIIHKESHHSNFLFPISMEQNNPNVKQKSAISDNQMPPNLRTTSRPASATRGRPINKNTSLTQKQDHMNTKTIRRQSCSPSVTRGRKPDASSTQGSSSSTFAKVQLQAGNNNRAQVVGSRMVDRFMNARIASVDHRQAKIKMNNSMNESLRINSSTTADHDQRQGAKIKLNGSLNESSGFGRLMPKSSVDMALKQMA